jgi:pimeloyl-ACP methyl ester carboxylesterase
MLATEIDVVHDGKRLRFARFGSGPPLVLLHGYPDNLQIWSRLAPILAARFEVIAFDWPGMGQSDPWSGGTTPAHQADRLRDLMDHWKIERTHVAGFDMGGQPALMFAAHYPKRIDRLVVMNSLTHGDAETSWDIRLLRQFGWNRVILRRLPAIVFRRAERTFLPPGTRLAPELRADLWECFQRAEVRNFVVRLCAGYQGTLSRLPEQYRKIACPTLALWGGADCHFPPVHADRLCADVPGAQKIVIPGGHHWMMWHAAEEVAGHVRRFLDG